MRDCLRVCAVSVTLCIARDREGRWRVALEINWGENYGRKCVEKAIANYETELGGGKLDNTQAARKLDSRDIHTGCTFHKLPQLTNNGTGDNAPLPFSSVSITFTHSLVHSLLL